MNWHVPSALLEVNASVPGRLGRLSQAVGFLSAHGLAGPIRWRKMSTAPSSEPTPQRLAAIRDQLKLLADYL
jgi:hypothetical protein